MGVIKVFLNSIILAMRGRLPLMSVWFALVVVLRLSEMVRIVLKIQDLDIKS